MFKRIIGLLCLVIIFAMSSVVFAEGTFQTGTNQDLMVDDYNAYSFTVLKVDI